MKKILFFSIMALLAARMAFAENDGTRPEKAVVIRNISNYENCRTIDSVDAEYLKSMAQCKEFIKSKFGYPGVHWKMGPKKILENDKLECCEEQTVILLPEGKKVRLYFDITEPINLYLDEMEKYQ